MADRPKDDPADFVWIQEAAEKLGVPADQFKIDEILDLTRDVAHNAPRSTAPLSAFVVGFVTAAGQSGNVEDVIAKVASYIPDGK